jgi:hypothetical protein
MTPVRVGAMAMVVMVFNVAHVVYGGLNSVTMFLFLVEI